MNFARNIVVNLLVVGLFVSSASAVQKLGVAVVFDVDTNYNYSQRFSKAKNFVKKMNKSFENSGLSSYVKFYLYTTSEDSIRIRSNETYDQLTNRYLNSNSLLSRTAKLSLQKAMKYSRADIVFGVVKPSNNSKKVCGRALRLPKKGDIWYNTHSQMRIGNYGIVFLTDSSSCENLIEREAHEVGHTFGLFHGKAVKDKLGYNGHYDTSKIIDKKAAGYGVKSGRIYGTLMAGRYLGGERALNNRFSDSSKNECGRYWWDKDNSCGNSNADATSFMKNYFYDYNKRGNWYRGFDGVKII